MMQQVERFTPDEDWWEQAINEQRPVVLQWADHSAAYYAPVALLVGRNGIYAHCRYPSDGGHWGWVNVRVYKPFDVCLMLRSNTFQGGPWPYRLGSHPSPGMTVVYRRER
jgi:hypothetical protein